MQKPPPCYQDWDAMEKVPGGRLCAQCDNTIVDFSKTTWEDILEIQKASQFTTCGKYSKKQIKHWGHQPPEVDLGWFRKLSFTGMLVLLGLKSVDAQVQITEQDTIVFTESNEVKDSIVAMVRFQGLVIDSVTKEPLSYAAVIITDEVKGGAYANEDGQFTINVKKSDVKGDALNAKITYVGYQDTMVVLRLDKIETYSLTRKEKEVVILRTHFRVEEPTIKLKPIGTIKSWFSED